MCSRWRGMCGRRGGQLSPDEAERAVTQLLEAVESAHTAGVRHGPIGLAEVLIDRRGSLLVELYGLERAMRGLGAGDAELARDEVRSVVEIGYQLITGLRAEAPLIPADRLVKKLDVLWARWLAHGLDPAGGFETVDEAIAALPSRKRVVEVKPSGGGACGRCWGGSAPAGCGKPVIQSGAGPAWP